MVSPTHNDDTKILVNDMERASSHGGEKGHQWDVMGQKGAHFLL